MFTGKRAVLNLVFTLVLVGTGWSAYLAGCSDGRYDEMSASRARVAEKVAEGKAEQELLRNEHRLVLEKAVEHAAVLEEELTVCRKILMRRYDLLHRVEASLRPLADAVAAELEQ